MRKTVHEQLEVVPIVGDHGHAQELKRMSEQLDAMPEVLDWIYADLNDRSRIWDKGTRNHLVRQFVA